MNQGIKAFSTKKWDIAKPQLKISDAVNKEEAVAIARNNKRRFAL